MKYISERFPVNPIKAELLSSQFIALEQLVRNGYHIKVSLNLNITPPKLLLIKILALLIILKNFHQKPVINYML